MAVFSVVVSIATGSFIRALRTQRQLVSFASANSNVSLVLEQMAREIRVGSQFSQPSREQITFVNGRGEQVTYAYDVEGKSIIKTTGTGAAQPLTSQNVDVRNLSFVSQYTDEEDDYPARVTVMVSVAPREVGVNTSVVRIQTTISARSLGT